MNTRSFFKSLALIAAGAATCPGIFIPKFEPVHWKVGRFTGEQFERMLKNLEPNPNWVDACENGEDWSCMISPGFFAAYQRNEWKLEEKPVFPQFSLDSLPEKQRLALEEQFKFSA